MMLTNLWCNPGRVIHLSFLLETELGIGHVHPGKDHKHDDDGDNDGDNDGDDLNDILP